jgi:pyruvate formate-lyase activating enzyme-like uncharacterized protein
LIEEVTAAVWERLRNPVFRDYAHEYLEIAEDFRAQVLSFGLPIAQKRDLAADAEHLEALRSRGVVIANDGKSLRLGWISPSCITCQKGVGAATFSISTQCTRDCFFCFNPNQVDFEQTRQRATDPIARLDEFHNQGFFYEDLALTGGEPLLHKAEALEFFRRARELYPDAYTRLYTSGSFLDEGCLKALKAVGLDEIRISIKTDDSEEEQARTLKRLEISKDYLTHAVVEMPVMPDELSLMKRLLKELDRIGISGINLLELCFPYHNAEEFAKRGYAIKGELLRVLYDYQYAGGLPVAKSEENCLLLLDYALDEGLSLGVHYCSLENKFTGQVYLQNISFADAYDFCVMSERDYFLKAAKAFGRDIEPTKKTLQAAGIRQFYHDPAEGTLAFKPNHISALKRTRPNMELGISYQIVEPTKEGNALRELRLDFTTPRTFECAKDV